MLFVSLFSASSEEIELAQLIRSTLENNPDLTSASYDVSSARLRYESLKAGAIPSLGFTTDTGNNPLYRYSDANEFSTETFTSARYNRHKFGGGLNLGLDLPTGGSLSLTGAGNLELSLSDIDAAEWNYLVNPAASLYLRQPLFIDRINESPLRFDSLQLADELASIGVEKAKLSRRALENNLIILITRTAAVLNSLNHSSGILESKIRLAGKRLKLALQDEEAGKLSSLDRLLEELQIRRLQETRIDLIYKRDSAARELEQLTGGSLPSESYVRMFSPNSTPSFQINPMDNLNVLNSKAAARSIELTGTTVQNGSEPVFEVSAIYRRSDSETAADIGGAFDDATSADMNLSLSMSLSLPVLDWGEKKKAYDAEKKSLLAAEERLNSTRKNAMLAAESAFSNLKLIEEKTVLLQKGLEYDRTLLEREKVRLEAGLSTEAAVETIGLDLLEREYSINQLQDEKILAIMELYNTGGVELKTFFMQD